MTGADTMPQQRANAYADADGELLYPWTWDD